MKVNLVIALALALAIAKPNKIRSLVLEDDAHPGNGLPVYMFCFHLSSLTCVCSIASFHFHCCQYTNFHVECIILSILYSWNGNLYVYPISNFHFCPSQGDLKYLVFTGVCLQRLHLSHLKYPFSSSGPFFGNLLGRAGLMIPATFCNLLLHGIKEPLGNTFLLAWSG